MTIKNSVSDVETGKQTKKSILTHIAPIIIAIALTPLALLAHSYKFVNDDQILYIPFLRHALNPTLYPNDYFLNQAQASISLFEDVLIWPIYWFGLDWAMLLGYLLAQMLILWGMYGLGKWLTANNKVAYLVMPLFILPISIGGTFVRTYDNYLNPRTLTLPLGLLSLMLLWQTQVWPAAILVSLHLLLHPLSGLHTAFITGLLFIWWVWKKEKTWQSLLGPSLLILAALGTLVWNADGGGSVWVDSTWEAVLWKRNAYVFLGSWKSEDWMSLALYTLIWLVGWHSRPRDSRTTRLNVAVLITVISFTFLVYLSADWAGFAPLLQLQLARSWRLAIILSLIFGADLVLSLAQRKSWGALLTATLLGVALYFDRADEEWQPIFGILLAAIVLTYILEKYRNKPNPLWENSILAFSGLLILGPALLNKWSITKDISLPAWFDFWQLPEEGIWPALFIFGVSLIFIDLKQKPAQTQRSWLKLGVGALLSVYAFSGQFAIWQAQDWTSYVNKRLQLPISDAWMSDSFAAWQDVQLWAAQHTPPTAIFATDPDEKGFRVFSERAPIVEDKDGASAMFNRTHALTWRNRLEALALSGVVDPDSKTELSEFSAEGLVKLHTLYPFDYIVGRHPQHLPWEVAYQNGLFIVYQWPEEGE